MNAHNLHLGPVSIGEPKRTPHDFGGTSASYFHEAAGTIGGDARQLTSKLRRAGTAYVKLPQIPEEVHSLADRLKAMVGR